MTTFLGENKFRLIPVRNSCFFLFQAFILLLFLCVESERRPWYLADIKRVQRLYLGEDPQTVFSITEDTSTPNGLISSLAVNRAKNNSIFVADKTNRKIYRLVGIIIRSVWRLFVVKSDPAIDLKLFTIPIWQDLVGFSYNSVVILTGLCKILWEIEIWEFFASPWLNLLPALFLFYFQLGYKKKQRSFLASNSLKTNITKWIYINLF